jgi:hypothetical protein
MVRCFPYCNCKVEVLNDYIPLFLQDVEESIRQKLCLMGNEVIKYFESGGLRSEF